MRVLSLHLAGCLLVAQWAGQTAVHATKCFSCYPHNEGCATVRFNENYSKFAQDCIYDTCQLIITSFNPKTVIILCYDLPVTPTGRNSCRKEGNGDVSCYCKGWYCNGEGWKGWWKGKTPDSYGSATHPRAAKLPLLLLLLSLLLNHPL